MAATDRFFKAFKDVLLLTEAVKGLGQDVKDLNQEVRQLDRRMIRLDTMVELAEKRQLPLLGTEPNAQGRSYFCTLRAFDAVKEEGLVPKRSRLRQCRYLNKIVEQDHRFIKRQTRPMLGFKRFRTAWRTLRGIKIMNALREGQARWIAKGDVVAQTRLIHRAFGLAA